MWIISRFFDWEWLCLCASWLLQLVRPVSFKYKVFWLGIVVNNRWLSTFYPAAWSSSSESSCSSVSHVTNYSIWSPRMCVCEYVRTISVFVCEGVCVCVFVFLHERESLWSTEVYASVCTGLVFLWVSAWATFGLCCSLCLCVFVFCPSTHYGDTLSLSHLVGTQLPCGDKKQVPTRSAYFMILKLHVWFKCTHIINSRLV